MSRNGANFYVRNTFLGNKFNIHLRELASVHDQFMDLLTEYLPSLDVLQHQSLRIPQLLELPLQSCAITETGDYEKC